jgi:sugar lactone lactonase YvrE
VITTIAGTGVAGFGGDGGIATAARLTSPRGVAVDGVGNVFIADSDNHRIRRVDAASGVITTIAGTGVAGAGGDGGAGPSAQLAAPAGVAVDRDGNVYVADTDNHRVRRIDGAAGTITTVAGTGVGAFSGDGVPATSAALWFPYAVALGADGDLHIADSDNQRVRRVDHATGLIDTVLGNGGWGFAGDGGPALDAEVRAPYGVAVDRAGRIYLADTYNHRLRRVEPGSTTISTVAGVGVAGTSRDGGAATSAILATPHGVAIGADGDLYVVDTYHFRVRRIDAETGVISTIAGTGTYGADGDGGPALSAQLASTRGVALDAAGNVYIADDSHRVRRVDGATGVITTVAGTGVIGDSGDGGPAVDAELRAPMGVAIDAAGDLLVADRESHRVRRIDAVTGLISTVAGTGVADFSGDGGPAVAAALSEPSGVAVDADGNVYVADAANHRIRRIDAATGEISTVAGTGVAGFSGDGGPADEATLLAPRGLGFDATGQLYVADSDNQRIRRIDAGTGEITTVAGTGAYAFLGDGGLATEAALGAPLGLAVGAGGELLIADTSNLCVRRVDPSTGVITTVGGAVRPEGEGPVAQAVLATPAALVRAGARTLFASGVAGVVQALDDGGDELATAIGSYPQLAATADLAAFRAQDFGSVGGVAWDAATKQIYVTAGHAVHVVETDAPADGVLADDPTTWTIAVLAGAADAVGTADGALGAARFRSPTGLYFDDGARVLYVADAGNHTVRAIDVDGGDVTTIAGTPATLGYFGDGGAAVDALLYAPSAITRAPSGDLFIADAGNHRVRRVEVGSGVITTVLGDGVAASSGEGAPAWTFPVADPQGLATDARGNLFVTSSTAVRLLPATDGGLVDGAGAVQTIYGAAPRDTFPALATACLTGVAVIDADTTWVTDRCAGLLVELRRRPLAP